MRENSKARFGGINVGGASLVMVFSVLCLTIFAVLSAVTAKNELELAQSSAGAVTEYYAADSLATEIMESLSYGETPEGVTEEADGYFSYNVPVNDRQTLNVRLQRRDGGEVRIVCWEVGATGEWTAEQHIEVWDGE